MLERRRESRNGFRSPSSGSWGVQMYTILARGEKLAKSEMLGTEVIGLNGSKAVHREKITGGGENTTGGRVEKRSTAISMKSAVQGRKL